MSESCRREIVLWRSKHISNLVSLLKLFSPVLSASKASDEEWLSFSEKTSPAAFLKAVRVSGKEAKDSKGRKKERKERRKERNRQQREEACRGRSGNGRRRRRTDSTDTKKPRSVSASGLPLRRRLPTLPLAQYHRRDEA